jgi:hypothetical protein
MSDWAMGITEFSVYDKYSVRSTDEECTRCGAKPDYLCFEIASDSRGFMKPYPLSVCHTLLREVPLKNQALSSGRSRAGC